MKLSFAEIDVLLFRSHGVEYESQEHCSFGLALAESCTKGVLGDCTYKPCPLDEGLFLIFIESITRFDGNFCR
jgi:hypothetical protein